MILPYGWYRLSVTYHQNSRSTGLTVFIAPLQTTRIDLLMHASAVPRLSDWPRALRIPGLWPDSAGSRIYPEAFSLPGVLASREPTTVSEPLNFTGLADNWLAIVSQRGFSWTDAQFKLAGLDATDSYQPGYPLIPPDVQTLTEVVARTGFALTSSNNGSTEIELYPNQPAHPGTGRYPAQIPIQDWRSLICRSRSTGGLYSKQSDTPGSPEIDLKSADR